MSEPKVYLKPKDRVLKVIELLSKEYPDAKIALNFSNPLELLVATILSAQCTDERVNKVTKDLFKKYTKPEDYANVDLSELEQDVRSTGFFRNKANNIQKASQLIVEKYEGKVPQTMQELVKLPGVARKTANIVLYGGFGKVAGVAVDTHVRRLSKRLGVTNNDNPQKIEQDLMDLTSADKWMKLTDLLIFHGRNVCLARKPKCSNCVLSDYCPSAFTFD